MINTKSFINKELKIILPNTNRALNEVLKDLSAQEVQTLSAQKDLRSILNSLLKDSLKTNTQDTMLLNLLKNNPTLKNLGDFKTSIESFLKDLSPNTQSDKTLTKLEEVLKNFSQNIKDISSKELHQKLLNSGVFLESKLKNTQDISHDLKALLLRAKDALQSTDLPNKAELLKHADKLLLQIDYYQLSSHLSNSATVFIPYAWDALEEGNISLKKTKEKKFFCDIELKLKEYGELNLRLGMFETNQLYLSVDAQSSELKKMILNNLNLLKEQLNDIHIVLKETRFKENNPTPYSQNTQSLELGFEAKV